MASAPPADDSTMMERFLSQRGHDIPEHWERDAMKKQCPDCGGLHDLKATECAVCGWIPVS